MHKSYKYYFNLFSITALIVAFIILGACSEGGIKLSEPTMPPDMDSPLDRLRASQPKGSVFGEGGLMGNDGDGIGGSGIGVNSFLWRATLDTVAFMPITSADPFGGVILTDWHAAQDTPEERFKLNIYILGRELRADGIRVSVFRQVLYNQVWRDAQIQKGISAKIEDAILVRARQLRAGALAD